MPSPGENPGTVILADGAYPSGEVAAGLLAQAERVVCCDGATAAYVLRGGSPYAIVGDCDSLCDELKERYADILHCDRDRETNDLTKAVNFCIGEGFDELTVLGATGKREDHTIGNVSLLADYGALARVRMVTDYGVFDPIYEDMLFESFQGQQVTIFTFSPETLITTGENLKYPLHQAKLTRWWQGSLNESTGRRFGVIATGATVVYRVFR